MNASAKMTSKGQITVPVELRRALGLKPGDQVHFRMSETGNYEIVAKPRSFSDLRGLIKIDGKAPTPEQIVEIVDKARTDRARHIVERLGDSEA